MTLAQMIESVRAQIAAKLDEREQHTKKIEEVRAGLADDSATLSEDQLRTVKTEDEARRGIDAALVELRAREADLVRENEADEAAAALSREVGSVHPQPASARASVTSEPNPVYRKDHTDASFFRDLWDSRQGDRGASQRLAQSQERAWTSVSGSGGEFAPPAWIVEDFAELARADRVVADVIGASSLPDGVSSINLPRITVGAGTAVQQTQSTTVTESGVTTTSVSSGVVTIAGKQKVSIQEIRQSAINIDQVILADLAASYAAQLDAQVISGSGTAGQLRGLVTAGTTVTYTSTSPKVVSTTSADSFYAAGLKALSAMATGRHRPGTEWFMSPRRWYWILSALDTTNRPIVAASGPGLNQAAVTAGEPVAEGYGGVFLGLPVHVDGNIPTNLGASTNQDVVFLTRRADLRLWETPLELTSFDATHADDAAILFRALGFSAFIPDRHADSVQVISGTGLAAPSF